MAKLDARMSVTIMSASFCCDLQYKLVFFEISFPGVQRLQKRGVAPVAICSITISPYRPSCMRQVAITTVCSLLARAMSEENARSATYVGMQIAAIRSNFLTRCLIHNPKHKDHLNRMNVNEPVYILFRCIILYIEI